jgi:hypothetical protein
MPLVEVNIPKIAAPAISVPTLSTTVTNVESAAKVPAIPSVNSAIFSMVPKISAPEISMGGLPPIPSVSSLTSGLLPKMAVPSISGLTGLSFGGMGLAGILGGTKKPYFAQNVIPKLQSLVPKFSPGLILSLGSIAAAVSMVKTAMAVASEAKSLASGGISGLVTQVEGVAMGAAQSELAGVTSGVTGQIAGATSAVAGLAADATGKIAHIGGTATVAGVTVNVKPSGG